MTDPWFYERTCEGWEIRDENRLLVALVPDAQHEREHDAQRIACSSPPDCSTTPMLPDSPARDQLRSPPA